MKEQYLDYNHQNYNHHDNYNPNIEWAKRMVKELQGYSDDSIIIDKLMKYSESSLDELIKYTGNLKIFNYREKRIGCLAQEAKHQLELIRIAKERERIKQLTNEANKYLDKVRDARNETENQENLARIAKNAIVDSTTKCNTVVQR